MNKAIGSTWWLNAAMGIDLFDADRDPYDRLLHDRMVVAKTTHLCPTCQETIQKGDWYRKTVIVDGGELHSLCTCANCLTAMLDWAEGKIEAFEARIQQGRQRHEAAQA